jgi:hypothetical protein
MFFAAGVATPADDGGTYCLGGPAFDFTGLAADNVKYVAGIDGNVFVRADIDRRWAFWRTEARQLLW